MSRDSSIFLSIIIPAYNEEERLPATLDRIFEYLHCRKWDFSEVIVVDDRSRDRTPAILAPLARVHQRLRVVRR